MQLVQSSCPPACSLWTLALVFLFKAGILKLGTMPGLSLSCTTKEHWTGRVFSLLICPTSPHTFLILLFALAAQIVLYSVRKLSADPEAMLLPALSRAELKTEALAELRFIGSVVLFPWGTWGS